MIEYITYLYLLACYYYIYQNKMIEEDYIGLLIFIALKIIFFYKKCTISYLECKIRGVKKEEGYLYRFLDRIVSLRNTKHFYILFILGLYVLYYHFIIKKGGLYFFVKDRN